MALTFEAVYENGVLKLERALPPEPGGPARVADTACRCRSGAKGLRSDRLDGDAETVRRVALDSEFDILESL
jgi:predicted DNA-binding antitoxin AbrB/MazE fold protein